MQKATFTVGSTFVNAGTGIICHVMRSENTATSNIHLLKRETTTTKWIVAIGVEEDGQWDQGYYFEYLKDAENEFLKILTKKNIKKEGE